MRLSELERGLQFHFPIFKRLDNLDEKWFELGPELNFSVAFLLVLPLSDLKVPSVSCRKKVENIITLFVRQCVNETPIRDIHEAAIHFKFGPGTVLNWKVNQE